MVHPVNTIEIRNPETSGEVKEKKGAVSRRMKVKKS